jgi:hypothetical protein
MERRPAGIIIVRRHDLVYMEERDKSQGWLKSERK